jgi:hypothetical protein
MSTASVMRWLSIFLAVVAATAPLPAEAQGRCLPSMTTLECWNLYLPDTMNSKERSDAAAVSVMKDTVRADAVASRKRETGVDTQSARTAASTKNFLPILSAAGLIGDEDANGSQGTLNIDLNFLLPSGGNDKNTQLKAVINPRPSLFEPLTGLVTEDRAVALEATLGDLDDYGLVLSYNLWNRGNGRNFMFYRRRFSALVEGIVGPAKPVSGDFASLVAMLGELPGDDLEQLPLSETPIDRRIQFINALESFAQSEAAIEADLTARIDDAGLRYFADLVSNQPQLYFSLESRIRDDLVGPDELAARLTWEFGFANINAYEKSYGRACRAFDQPGRPADESLLRECATTFSDYINANRTRIRSGERFALSFEWARTDDLHIFIPEDDVDLEVEGTHKLVAAVGYGRLLMLDPAQEPTLRIDASASYEDVSDDPARQNRLIIAVTLTKRFGDLSIPISVVYANHGEYLTDVDDRLSANIGIAFDIFGALEPGSP